MKLSLIPCTYPACNCPEPKLHKGAKAIAERFRMEPRQVFRSKGLPVQHWGTALIVRECIAQAFIEGRLT